MSAPIRMVGLTPEQERLLGAAPELLRTLRELYELLDGDKEMHGADCMTEAHAAIARAEGRGGVSGTYVDGPNPPGGWSGNNAEHRRRAERENVAGAFLLAENLLFESALREALRTLSNIAAWNLVARPGHSDYMNRAGVVARAALAYADLQRTAKVKFPDAALRE